MSFSTTDKISQASRGSVERAYTYAKTDDAHRPFLRDYLNELWRLCQIAQLDFAILFAQFCDETDRGTSAIFYSQGNPAGIGIFPDGTTQSRVYKTGKEAAQAHVVHMHAYVFGRIPASSMLYPYISLDPRYSAAISAYGGQVTTIAALAGRWATNTNYANQIVGHANAAFPITSSTKDTPTMTSPTIVDKYLHVTQDGYAGVERRYPGQNGHKIIVIHIQEGTSWGSWTWFHQVSASSTVFVNRDGSIWRLVPETDGPWTNGDVQSPTAKGRDIINRYGADPNKYTLSIETEGYASSNNAMGWSAWPKPQAQLDAVVWQVKDWMQRYNIPIENVIRHADINQVTRPGCPGDTFYNYVINAVKEDSTPVSTKPVYADRHPVVGPDGKPWNGSKDITVKGAVFHAEKRTCHVASVGVFREYASIKSGRTRSDMTKGKGFSVLGWVNGEAVDGETRWWITTNFSRIHVSGTVEKPSEATFELPAEDDAPQNPNESPDIIEYGPEIVNGRAYYPISTFVSNEAGDGVTEVHELKVIVTEKDAPARRSVTKHSPVHHTYHAGDELVVTHFVVGDEIDGEAVWWVIKPADDSNPIHHGLRVPCAFTNIRPS